MDRATRIEKAGRLVALLDMAIEVCEEFRHNYRNQTHYERFDNALRHIKGQRVLINGYVNGTVKGKPYFLSRKELAAMLAGEEADEARPLEHPKLRA